MNETTDKPLDTFHLPWPLPSIPPYSMDTKGRLRFAPTPVPLSTGYFSGMRKAQHVHWALTQRNQSEWKTLDTLTTRSLEAAIPLIAAARGKVVLCGLGMGVILHNILRNPAVTEVHIYEKDARKLEMLITKADLYDWPGWSKVKHTRTGGGPLAVPINPRSIRPDVLIYDRGDDISRQRNIYEAVRLTERFGATATVWTGMELDFIEWLHVELHGADYDPATKVHAEQVTADAAEEWAKQAYRYRLNPRPVTAFPGWPEMAFRAVTNATEY